MSQTNLVVFHLYLFLLRIVCFLGLGGRILHIIRHLTGRHHISGIVEIIVFFIHGVWVSRCAELKLGKGRNGDKNSCELRRST